MALLSPVREELAEGLFLHRGGGEVTEEVVKARPGEALARRWVQDSPRAFGSSLTR